MMTETSSITVDGRRAEAPAGAMLLDVIRGMGIQVPTLCHHPSLESSGACRLCVVEITHKDWKGWSGLVTSCLYPVEPGLEVDTRSERVVAARRTLLEMLLARCPDAEAVREMARVGGIEATTFPVREGADKCVLCGLCVRVCQDLGPAALAPLGRGAEKEVGPRPDKVGEDCTGCGACALICPTDEIEMRREPGLVRIWNREFAIPAFGVDPGTCRGCGVCEEVCPLAIPRVVPRRTGALVSFIAADVCVGCGLCAGACPAGAIGLAQDEELLLSVGLDNRIAVFACSRSPLSADGFAESYISPIEVPCVGRVTVEEMLECLARGSDGVLVMGRDKETCPHGPGEDQAEERVRVAADLAEMAGLGAGRVRFAVPAAGYEGPTAALAACRGETPTSALASSGGIDLSGAPDAGLDRARAIMRQLFEQPGLNPVLPADLAKIFAGVTNDAAHGAEADTLLYLGELPVLDRLLSLTVPGGGFRKLFEDAAALLKEKNLRVRPVLSAREVAESDAKRVVAFCGCCLPDFGRPVEVVTLDALAGREAPSDRERSAEAESAPAGFRFTISPQERTAMAAALAAAISSPDAACRCPGQAAQVMLLGREGAWQSGHPHAGEPLMAFQQAVRDSAGRSVS